MGIHKSSQKGLGMWSSDVYFDDSMKKLCKQTVKLPVFWDFLMLMLHHRDVMHFIMLWFSLVKRILVDPFDLFADILHGYFTDTEAIICLPQWQWRCPEDRSNWLLPNHNKPQQTTTKHNKTHFWGCALPGDIIHLQNQSVDNQWSDSRIV